jgi:hypothetical protein
MLASSWLTDQRSECLVELVQAWLPAGTFSYATSATVDSVAPIPSIDTGFGTATPCRDWVGTYRVRHAVLSTGHADAV